MTGKVLYEASDKGKRKEKKGKGGGGEHGRERTQGRHKGEEKKRKRGLPGGSLQEERGYTKAGGRAG